MSVVSTQTQVSGTSAKATVSIVIPLPNVKVAIPPIIPKLSLPELSKALSWLNDSIAFLPKLIEKLVAIIPEAEIRLKVYVKVGQTKTMIYDTTIGI